jgi:hypothetical protein
VLVAQRTGRMAATKREGVAFYRELVAGEWAPFVDAVHEHGWRRWNYLVPSEDADRALLRELCARTLAFERYYLALRGDTRAGW